MVEPHGDRRHTDGRVPAWPWTVKDLLLQGSHPLRSAHGLAAAAALTALAALLPLVPALVPPLLLLSVVFLAVRHRPWRKAAVERQPADRAMVCWLALYLLHGAGMAWSSNTEFGLFDLQVKLPLFLFPLIFLRMPRAHRRGGGSLLRAFVAGNASAVVLCCAWVPVHALSPGGQWSTAVFGSDFSLFLHPSYFALYLCFALATVLLAGNSMGAGEWARRSLVFLLCTGTVLCGSKAGWAGLVIVLLTTLVFRWHHRQTRRTVSVLFGAFALALGLLVLASPNVRERMAEAWQAVATPSEHADAATSSEERKLAWAGAVEVIRANLPFGTGTGDVKDELVASYARNGYQRLVELRLNAHQQYLQTMAALGWPGLLLLAAALAVSLHMALHAKDALATAFLLLNLFNWTVESMLEVQAGVVFFAFLFFVLAIRSRPAVDARFPDPLP